jgi:hypothetical protein
MLVICAIRSHRLPLLQDAIAERNKVSPVPWGIFELERFDIAGIPISRIALLCDELPPDDKEIAIEAIIRDRYCVECLKQGKFHKLQRHNQSGWCARHQDRNPERTIRKRKKI